MNVSVRLGITSCSAALLLITLSCSGAGSDSILGSGDAGTPTMASFAANGEIPIQEGLSIGADPEEIVLDPCDPEAPTDPATGKLQGKTTIGAFVRDDELLPVEGVEVVFSASAGDLESMGQAVLTDERGLATDVLAVDEDVAGDIVVTAVAGELTDDLTVPVILLDKPAVTLSMRPPELWPPNHKMRPVRAVFDGLDCHPETTFVLVSVTSSEPDDDGGDGNTTDDIQDAEIGTPDLQWKLRAERAGGGDGRVYTATYELTDDSGEVSTLEATVTVPHDQGN